MSLKNKYRFSSKWILYKDIKDDYCKVLIRRIDKYKLEQMRIYTGGESDIGYIYRQTWIRIMKKYKFQIAGPGEFYI